MHGQALEPAAATYSYIYYTMLCMYVMLYYVMLFYYVYTDIRVCMPARAQEGGGGDAGVKGGLRCVGGEGGKAEHNII